jgi:hypothetical protein
VSRNSCESPQLGVQPKGHFWRRPPSSTEHVRSLTQAVRLSTLIAGDGVRLISSMRFASEPAQYKFTRCQCASGKSSW